MKKYKYTIFTIILFLICISNTYAACTQEEINEFKKIEDQYKITYEFNKSTKDYTVTFDGVEPKKYVFSIKSGEPITNCKKINDYKTECYNVKKGNYIIETKGTTDSCKDTLKTITLNLKGYNKYHEDPMCDGIEEFVLCQETYDKEIDYDTFVSRVETYKRTKEKEKPILNEQKEETIQNKMIKYIKIHLLEIIVIILFVVLVFITTIVTAKSIKKSRRLE